LLQTDFGGYFGIEYEEPSDVYAGTERSLENLRRQLAEAGIG
jgi:hypothetical protein